MNAKRIDHIGIVVNDLEATKSFFLDLGMEVTGEAEIEGDWVDRVIGLNGARSTCTYMRTAEEGTSVELIKFHSPETNLAPEASPSNALGIRHFAMLVENFDDTIAKLQAKGSELVGTAENYENIYKVCYVRGPEGIIVEVAQQMS